jgi:predicted acyl esterase
MPGKWSAYKDTLPRLDGNDPSYQERVNERKQAFSVDPRTQGKPSLGLLGDWYNQKRLEKDALNEQLSDVNLELEALTQILVDKLEETGLTQVRLTDGSTLSLKDEPYTKVTDRETFVAWIKSQGLDALLSVNYMSANSLVKERLMAGEPAPDGVDVFLKTSLTRRKA